MPGRDDDKRRRLLIISPCRDEEQFMRQTLDSVVAQTVLPSAWVIVDDGSTDRSPEILAEYAAKYPFISVIRRQDRGRRAVGPGVIEAFYAGLDSVDLDDFDYLCKLDLDLEIPRCYFEQVLEQMEREPWLANFSGKPYLRAEDGRLISERLGDENAVGQIKLYRTAAFKAIGGFVRQVSWDGIDGHMCRMHGWMARSEDRPELRFIHLRQMGSSQHSIWVGRLRWGFGKYFMGSALYYVAAVALYRMLERPYLLGGWGILLGYLKAMLGRVGRLEDKQFRRFLRRFELYSLIIGKRRTTDWYHRRIRERRRQSAPPGERPSSDGKRVLCVASGGGHWVELMRLAPAFGGHNVAFATVDRRYVAEVSGARFHTIQDVTRWDTWRCAKTLVKLAWILATEKPDVVVSTGALPGYMAVRLAKWFGAKTIWLDSIANVDSLSMSGQRAGKHADLWLTQWPHLAKPGGPLYRGTVL
jgi:biofilm PGA synthesis N-glycosyltransferase PgaC